jgi:hypothetical protein
MLVDRRRLKMSTQSYNMAKEWHKLKMWRKKQNNEERESIVKEAKVHR